MLFVERQSIAVERTVCYCYCREDNVLLRRGKRGNDSVLLRQAECATQERKMSLRRGVLLKRGESVTVEKRVSYSGEESVLLRRGQCDTEERTV